MKRNRNIFILFFAMLIPLWFSCTTTSYISVDLEALSAGKDPKNYAYKIETADKNISEDDLLFTRLKNMLKDSLVKNGFTVTDFSEEANAVLEFTAGISSPIQKSGTTAVTTNSYYNSSTKQTTYYTTGGDTYYYNTYQRTIILDVKDYNSRTNEKGASIWRMEVLSEGSSNDMQYLLSKFILAMEKYYGEDTNGRKSISIVTETDDDTGKEIKTEVIVK